MRIVEKAVLPPYECAVTGRVDGKILDTMVTFPPGVAAHLYLREGAVMDMARMFGAVSREDHAEAQARIKELELRIATSEHEAQAAKDLLDAAHNFKQSQKKTKAKEKVPA